MSEFNVSPEIIAHYVREAERMRAEALRELLSGARGKLARAASSLARRIRALGRRRKWNLSVPAPHH